jgi:hypothetical protein
MEGLTTLGGLFLLGGVIALVVAWVKALMNLRRLGDTMWFKAVLWRGIAGIVTMPVFGLGAFLLGSVLAANLLAGPDGLAEGVRSTTLSKTTIARWATRGFSLAGAGGLVIPVVAISSGTGRPLEGVLWPSLALVSLGFTALVAGSIAVGAAWWGALFNARLLAHNAWFKRLLWSGIAAAATMPLFGFGVLILGVVLLAYWRSAPDGMTVQPTQLPTRWRDGDRDPGRLGAGPAPAGTLGGAVRVRDPTSRQSHRPVGRTHLGRPADHGPRRGRHYPAQDLAVPARRHWSRSGDPRVDARRLVRRPRDRVVGCHPRRRDRRAVVLERGGCAAPRRSPPRQRPTDGHRAGVHDERRRLVDPGDDPVAPGAPPEAATYFGVAAAAILFTGFLFNLVI